MARPVLPGTLKCIKKYIFCTVHHEVMSPHVS